MDVILISIMEPDRRRGSEWLGVEVRHFAALQALAEEGSFGRAARRLGYTQSAVSQQIATLERIVDEKLVERPGGPRPVALTEAGLLLLRHAHAIVARLQAAQADLHALRSGEAGHLRVGTIQSVGARVLPEIMRRFMATWPQIEITLEERDDERELAVAVERGALDLAFVAFPPTDLPLETIELLRDPFVLVVAASSPFAQSGRTPTLREIAAAPLIGFRGCRTMDPVEQALRSAGVEPTIAFRSDDNGTVQGLVAAGIGNAVVPRLTVDAGDPRVTVIDLGNRIPPRLIAIARHRDRYHSPAARAFVATAQEACTGTETHLAA
jgi:molybdate transport repressor ModE-like protein